MIAAANLTQQRLLAVQTNIRGFLISGNPDLMAGYRDGARRRFRPRRSSCSCWSSATRRSAGCAELIREEALGYVNTYADPVIARTREAGRRAPGGRSRPPPRARRGPRTCPR